ncbi:MAG: enoyl-CoA hydratase/isomerase family protein [Panacagrimonas sp.]
MSAVLTERRGAVQWITLNRPQQRNAINGEVIAGITEGFQRAQADAEVRAIVLTAEGDKAFCAGGDLKPGSAFAFDVAEPTAPYANLLRLVHNCPLPTVARVNGACMAGGMGLLCMTDLAIAADHAKFGLPEAKLGLFPFQVLSLLKDQIAPRVLRELVLTGRTFMAAEAKEMGLINQVVPAAELDTSVAELVDSLVANSPTALRRGKYALRATESMSFEQAIAFTESQLTLMAQSEDAREGMASFNEKRKPTWTGK